MCATPGMECTPILPIQFQGCTPSSNCSAILDFFFQKKRLNSDLTVSACDVLVPRLRLNPTLIKRLNIRRFLLSCKPVNISESLVVLLSSDFVKSRLLNPILSRGRLI